MQLLITLNEREHFGSVILFHPNCESDWVPGFMILTEVFLHVGGSASSTNYKCLLFRSNTGTEHTQLVGCFYFFRRQSYDNAKIHTKTCTVQTCGPTLSRFIKVELMNMCGKGCKEGSDAFLYAAMSAVRCCSVSD